MKMTDATLIAVCARRMEPFPDLPGGSDIWGVTISYKDGEQYRQGFVKSTYNPLKNDAQAMALLKKFQLHVSPDREGKFWSAANQNACAFGADLNRAIVECVANMQAKK